MHLPELRPTPTKATSHHRAPFEAWSLSFLTVARVAWLGLLSYIPFKVCISAMYLFSLGAEVKYQSRKKKIVSACWSSDLRRAAFQSGGVFDFYTFVLTLTVDLGTLSHYSEILSSFWSLFFSYISRAFWTVLHSILLMLVLVFSIQIQLNSG